MNTKEQNKQKHKEWRLKNRDRLLVYYKVQNKIKYEKYKHDPVYKMKRKQYYAENKDKISLIEKERYMKRKEQIKDAVSRYLFGLKKTVFDHYGWICNCCGETLSQFLTLDHVNNDGKLDKNKNGNRVYSGTLYNKIIKLGFPNDYQVLCWNCNCGKSINKGICPHKN